MGVRLIVSRNHFLDIWGLTTETHRWGLKALAGDFVVNSICWELDVTRSTLLQDILENLVERFGPCRIGNRRGSAQKCLRDRERFRHLRKGIE